MRLTPRVAGFRSEYPAGFKLECMAGFVGTRTGDVGDDVVQLKIHLRQGLLHMLNVRGCVLQQLSLIHI